MGTFGTTKTNNLNIGSGGILFFIVHSVASLGWITAFTRGDRPNSGWTGEKLFLSWRLVPKIVDLS